MDSVPRAFPLRSRSRREAIEETAFTAGVLITEVARWVRAVDNYLSESRTQSEGTIGELAALLWAAAATAISTGEEALKADTLAASDYLGPCGRRRVFERGLGRVDPVRTRSGERAEPGPDPVRRGHRLVGSVVAGEVLDRGVEAKLPERQAEGAEGGGGVVAARPVVGEQGQGVLELEVLGLLLTRLDTESGQLDEQVRDDAVELAVMLGDPPLAVRLSISPVLCTADLRLQRSVQASSGVGLARTRVHHASIYRSGLHGAGGQLVADGLGGVTERGVLTATDEEWTLARSRAAVIAELAGLDVVGHEAVDEAAVAMGISRRQVYSLVARWRSGRGAVSDLLPGRSSGGRGRSRVSVEVDTVIGDVLRARYLRRQRPSVASVHRSILRACRLRGLPAPSRGTVERRIAALEPRVVAAARGGPDAARSLRSAGGEPPRLQRLLEQVQIDHTVIDLVVVDDQLRSPVGRPYLTVAIDVLSRSIVGLVVTLDPPSTTSVGLCLSHMVADKQVWIEQLGAAASWPMSGKPEEVFVDNGAEFHSEALTRGCEEHGIVLTYRPEGAPHYGGVVERLIGTLMREVHELPGTTFSNPADRGTYDSDATAALTLSELQRWLVLLVSAYHQQVHDTLGRPPAAVWAEQASELPPTVVHDPTAFLVDFLPVLRRRLTRTGVQIDHIQYFADALKPLIARRAQLDRLVVRRDPRDLSRIWVLHPDTDTYLPIGYRYQSRPAISQWEQRAAAARLREQGRSEVDEQALFDTVETMRQISDTAQRSSRSARRARARRPATPRETPAADPPRTEPAAAAADAPLVQPFADIEQW